MRIMQIYCIRSLFFHIISLVKQLSPMTNRVHLVVQSVRFFFNFLKVARHIHGLKAGK